LICGALSPNHIGGIPQTSAIDTIIATLNPISNSLYSTRSSKTIQERYIAYSSLLCMDIQGAFNATSTKTLACIMEAWKMPDHQIKWANTMSQDRQLSFPFDDKIESPKPALDVLPQGFPPSPIRFAIIATAILEIPPPTTRPPSGFRESKRHSGRLKPAKLPLPFLVQIKIAYVDEVSVSLFGKDIPINTTNMALVAQNLTTRAHFLNLSFSAEKFLLHLH
jgi:hypothetical protein